MREHGTYAEVVRAAVFRLPRYAIRVHDGMVPSLYTGGASCSAPSECRVFIPAERLRYGGVVISEYETRCGPVSFRKDIFLAYP